MDTVVVEQEATVVLLLNVAFVLTCLHSLRLLYLLVLKYLVVMAVKGAMVVLAHASSTTTPPRSLLHKKGVDFHG